MFDKTKRKISNYILNKKFSEKVKQIKFKSLMDNVRNVLLILPENGALISSMEVIKYFIEKEKYVTIVVKDNKASEVLSQFRVNCIPYGEKSRNIVGLPKGNVVNALIGNHYDIVCDLNLEPDEFTTALANYAESDFKVGFYNESLCSYFNFVIKKTDNSSDENYKFLIKSIDKL